MDKWTMKRKSSLVIVAILAMIVAATGANAAEALVDLHAKAKAEYDASMVKATETARKAGLARKVIETHGAELKRLQALAASLKQGAARLQDRDKGSKKKIAELEALKKKIEIIVARLTAATKDIASRTYEIKDAWFLTTVRADWVDYGQMLVILDSTFANKKIKMSMIWDFEDTPGTIEKLGRAILAASYSTEGVNNLDLSAITPEPWATLGCPGDLMLTVKGGRAEVSAPVVLWPFKQGDNAQRWRLAENGTIATTLNNQQDLVLDIDQPTPEQGKPQPPITSGTGLVLMPLGDSPTQRWTRQKAKSGKGVMLVNDGSGFVLDCGQDAKLGSAAIAATKAEKPVANQAWELTEISLKDQSR